MEAETLRKLAEIRAAIGGEITSADGLEAVRAALTRLFKAFIVHLDGDTARIEAVVRDETGAWTLDEELTPVLRERESLGQAEDNEREGFASRFAGSS